MITTKPVTEPVQIGRDQAVPGDVLLVASLAPGVADTTASGQVRVNTNHPDSEVSIAYSLRIRPVIEADPTEIRLLLQEGNTSSRTMLVRVQHNLRGEFKVTGSQPSSPELFRAQIVDGDISSRPTPWPSCSRMTFFRVP